MAIHQLCDSPTMETSLKPEWFHLSCPRGRERARLSLERRPGRKKQVLGGGQLVSFDPIQLRSIFISHLFDLESTLFIWTFRVSLFEFFVHFYGFEFDFITERRLSGFSRCLPSFTEFYSGGLHHKSIPAIFTDGKRFQTGILVYFQSISFRWFPWNFVHPADSVRLWTVATIVHNKRRPL